MILSGKKNWSFKFHYMNPLSYLFLEIFAPSHQSLGKLRQSPFCYEHGHRLPVWRVRFGVRFVLRFAKQEKTEKPCQTEHSSPEDRKKEVVG